MAARSVPAVLWALAAVVLLHGPLAPPVAAHDGPPYPVIVGHRVGSWMLEVWADPDVGTGTFYVVLTAPDGGPIDPPDRLRVHVRPVNGGQPETSWDAERTDDEELRYEVRCDFPTREWWTARFELSGSGGSGVDSVDVEVTPPGLGPIDVLWFLLPFLGFGFVYIKLVLKRRSYRRGLAQHEAQAPRP